MRRLFNCKKFVFIFGLSIGVIIMGGISYGVNLIQSSSVSYTRDGKTMSVEQAIDDLIVKVNKKNEQISVSINPGGTLQLKSTEENVTWESSNSNIATVDSNGLVTAKSSGTAKITVKNDSMSASINVTVSTAYLADVASVGDYVAYDAGSWTSSAGLPSSHGQFGGYTKGQNKANSVSVCDNRFGGNVTLKGWRVFKVDRNTKTITLIHAGNPECNYQHFVNGDSSASLTNLNSRATNEYLNRDYADSAHMMNKAEADQNILRTTGGYYWLATDHDNGTGLWFVDTGGNISGNNGASFGVRPVIVLKSKILTTGKGTDKVGQEAWTLVKP